MSEHRNVFENNKDAEPKTEAKKLEFRISREDRAKFIADDEMWATMEQKGFLRGRPTTVYEDFETGALIVVQEQT